MNVLLEWGRNYRQVEHGWKKYVTRIMLYRTKCCPFFFLLFPSCHELNTFFPQYPSTMIYLTSCTEQMSQPRIDWNQARINLSSSKLFLLGTCHKNKNLTDTCQETSMSHSQKSRQINITCPWEEDIGCATQILLSQVFWWNRLKDL